MMELPNCVSVSSVCIQGYLLYSIHVTIIDNHVMYFYGLSKVIVVQYTFSCRLFYLFGSFLCLSKNLLAVINFVCIMSLLLKSVTDLSYLYSSLVLNNMFIVSVW